MKHVNANFCRMLWKLLDCLSAYTFMCVCSKYDLASQVHANECLLIWHDQISRKHVEADYTSGPNFLTYAMASSFP